MDLILRSLVLACVALVWVVVLVRLNGLRSLSKMTNFDFVMTVALGSLLAGAAQATEWKGFAQACLAMVGLFLTQATAAYLRRSHEKVESLMQNAPTLVMRDGKILHDALAKTRMAESDLIAKLREANVLDFAKVRAVVLETTGDVSVLHGDTLDETLIENVTRVDRG